MLDDAIFHAKSQRCFDLECNKSSHSITFDLQRPKPH